MKANEWIPENDKTEAMKMEENKLPFFATQKGRGVSALLMFLILAVFFAFSLSSKSGAITFQMNEEMLGITCLKQNPVFIPYADITKVELTDSFSMGEKRDALDWDSGWCGSYENEEYGIYTIYAYSNVNSYIVVHYTDGVLVFNLKKEKTTEKTYDKLLKYCGLETE